MGQSRRFGRVRAMSGKGATSEVPRGVGSVDIGRHSSSQTGGLESCDTNSPTTKMPITSIVLASIRLWYALMSPRP
jgi:hypothetical protein